ncbi:flagellin [Asticcacaulis sp. AC402]|uniref:flagellin n=1 Tax=Asticcacaulis sp. AC402 TaxID=1282361 RepID=UPI0004CE8358|nr:flagellin [Asticcacaulis sp. AC402]
MAASVHTNTSAMIALQNLNATNRNMDEVQKRISTGLDVSTAKDNSAVYSIAQSQRADLSGLNAVRDSLNRANSIADVSMAAGESISDLMNQLREKVVAGMDSSIDTASRNALDSDFQAIVKQIKQISDNATFNGSNLFDGTITNDIQFIANADADATITLSVKDLTFGGAIITLATNANILTATTATALLSSLDTSISNVNAALGELGSQARQIEGHLSFIAKLDDAISSGIGNLVDADMAKESSRLQALQVQQQLGTQSLSIANQGPQQILSLFQG